MLPSMPLSRFLLKIFNSSASCKYRPPEFILIFYVTIKLATISPDINFFLALARI